MPARFSSRRRKNTQHCCRSCATSSDTWPGGTPSTRQIGPFAGHAEDVLVAHLQYHMVRERLERGQLNVVTSEETYLRGGHFSMEGMLTQIQEALEAGARLGYPLTRLLGHPELVLEDLSGVNLSGVNEFIEYEMRLNDVLPSYDDPVICLYDTNLLNGTLAVDILRTHPVAIIGGLLYENPFFVPPQEFLRQLQQRSGAPLEHREG